MARDVRTRRGTTLIEVLIAVAIGAAVMGGAMYLYHFGNKAFYKTTEHAAFREEALLTLETVARDVEGLMVSTGTKPGSGKYYLLEPYEFIPPVSNLTKTDPVTKQQKPYQDAYEGIRFWKYHSTEMNGAKPVMVGRKIEYTVKPADPGNPSAGKYLYRNNETRPVNKIPLAYIAFVKEPNEVTFDQIGGSQHGVLSVFIVPTGGNLGTRQNMTRDVIESLKEQKALVSRTFQLTGMESFYTVILNEAFRMASARKQQPTDPDDLTRVNGVYLAVYNDARQNNAAAFNRARARFTAGGAVAMTRDQELQNLFRIDHNTMFNEADAGRDQAFASAELIPGSVQADGATGDLTGTGGGGREE